MLNTLPLCVISSLPTWVRFSEMEMLRWWGGRKGRGPKQVGRAIRPWCKSDICEAKRKKTWIGRILHGIVVLKEFQPGQWGALEPQSTSKASHIPQEPCSCLLFGWKQWWGAWSWCPLRTQRLGLSVGMLLVAGDLRGTFYGFCPFLFYLFSLPSSSFSFAFLSLFFFFLCVRVFFLSVV